MGWIKRHFDVKDTSNLPRNTELHIEILVNVITYNRNMAFFQNILQSYSPITRIFPNCQEIHARAIENNGVATADMNEVKILWMFI